MSDDEGVVFWSEYKAARDERDRLRSDNATLLAERDAFQSMATQAMRERQRADAYRDELARVQGLLGDEDYYLVGELLEAYGDGEECD